MKKLFLLFALCCSLLLIFGCSETPQITEPTGDATIGVMVQRPQFIDSRPQTVIEQFTLNYTELANQIYKKPTPPPPDTGADPNPNPPHKYAYIVGISDYEGTANDLQYCDDDAIDMKAYFQSQGFTCRMDLDLNATGDAITAGLQWLIDNASPGDEIAFSYSGHGGNAPSYGSSLISADLYYVTHGYVMSYFNAINCSKKLVTIDACVIGDFHDDVVSGTFMATASDGSYSYDVPAFEHGAWTYFWLIGVNDLNKIFAEDAAVYAETEMKAWAKLYHVRVTPIHTDMYDGMFDM
ncbi:MAG: hypothetical protein CVT49_09750 [candidate division Zixibacteria bacterium HGW-Zixibacteria-1]|nr:MAG: hypothetical protein CVT49_09750 [candidate division Zixibacteria bacterium HGW-Zixibacteria-1]